MWLNVTVNVEIDHNFVQGTCSLSFEFQKCFVTSFRQCFGSIVQFHVATGTPDCWDNLVKDICGFCSSHLKSSTTTSDTEGLLGDFLLLTLLLRTNILITSLIWACNDVSWTYKSGYLARYSCLQAVKEYMHSPFTHVALRITT